MKRASTRVYFPKCTVCQYMKKHKEYRDACLRSTYFDPRGTESLGAVNDKWGTPVKVQTLYRHMQRHQTRDIVNAEALARLNGTPLVWQRTRKPKEVDKEALTNTAAVVEAPVGSAQQHEQGLDDFIQKGRVKLATGEMTINAANYLSAIKIKADIEKNTKDRRIELLRNMFSGAAPKGQEE